jgi:hypothetical protein
MVGVHQRRMGVPQATSRTVDCTSDCWFVLLHTEGGKSVKRYTHIVLRRMPPLNGFSIKTPEGKFLSDIRPRGIVMELNRLNDRIKQLEAKVDELHDLEKWLEGR